jgi:protein-disulfide isomerase
VRRGPDPDRRYTVKTEGAPLRGATSGKVTIVEFSDFQCPFCSRVAPTLAQLLTEYPDQLRIAYKHLPLDFHTKSPAAHAAAEAAHRQGKFWEMHDRIFKNQTEMSEEKYAQYAAEIGLDVQQFNRDRASDDVKRRIEADKSEASALGISGTPAFLINGRYVSGAQPIGQFKTLIEEELKSGKG